MPPASLDTALGRKFKIPSAQEVPQEQHEDEVAPMGILREEEKWTTDKSNPRGKGLKV